jgi:exodeoxyribonuclease V alpha subunit
LRKFSPPKDLQQKIDKLEREFGISYAAKQREAILSAVSQPVTVLTGGPGTGKTTTIRGMLAIFDEMGSKTVLAAPTGRAAKRMSELCGREAKTIHRLLEVGFDNNGMRFLRNTENPLEADVIILDEVSMVDISLMASLLAAVKNSCRLILVGDPDQLPSVGPGSVLKDILTSGAVTAIHLDEIFRQARESDIIMNAHAVNRGEMPSLKNKNKKDFFFIQRNASKGAADTVVDLCARRLPNNMGIDPEEIQVITPLKRNECGVEELNKRLQNVLNPHNELKTERVICGKLFRVGDRVMQVRNNYDMTWKKAGDESPAAETGTGVFNGDIGIIRSINLLSQTLTIDFDDRRYDYGFDNAIDLDLAYAVTVHKAQGSEFKAVIFVADARNSRILNRSLLYTAITRARELLVIVGNTESLGVMVANKRRYKRFSGLRTRLMGAAGIKP